MTSNSNFRECGKCKWWDPFPSSGKTGQCRIMPPLKNDLADLPGESSGGLPAVWPVTAAGDWCGKFTVAVDCQQDLINAIRPDLYDEPRIFPANRSEV